MSCGGTIVTKDGFCEKHAYLTATDSKYISEHIRIKLDKCHNTIGSCNRIYQICKLFRYLHYKENYIKRYPHFRKILISKCNEVICDEYVLKNKNDEIVIKLKKNAEFLLQLCF